MFFGSVPCVLYWLVSLAPFTPVAILSLKMVNIKPVHSVDEAAELTTPASPSSKLVSAEKPRQVT